MTIEAYWISGSPFSWRMLLALEIKQIEYQSKLLDVSNGDLKAEAFLQLNPNGKVPVLKDGDIIIYESIAILAYLESKFPAISLFGRAPKETGLIWQCIMELENTVHSAFYRVFWPLWMGEAASKAEHIKTKARRAQDELKKIDTLLKSNRYLVGNNVSAADIILFPSMQCLINALERADCKNLNLDILPIKLNYPNIAAWIKRIESSSGFSNTYPPHW